MTDTQDEDKFWFELQRKDRLISELREEIDRLRANVNSLKVINREYLARSGMSRESFASSNSEE